MPESMRYKILFTMKTRKRLLLPKALLAPNTDFSSLRKDGYIKIEKIDGYFYASITEKAETYLEQ
jgi:hypothetical protein